jgi:hypothetical protein
MKPQNLHAHEDRLLDFAYGELPEPEARVVESHLQGCTRCTELLDGIRGVRTTMAQLPMEPAPDAGLESLLAYAQQAARNAAAGPPLKPTWWRRWLIPAMGVTAVSVFGLVTLQVSKTVDLSPDLSASSERKSQEQAASVVETPPPAALTAEPMLPAENKPASPVANAQPPEPEAVAKEDSDSFDKLGKVAPKKKVSMKPGSYAPSSDWSNAGVGAGRALEQDAYEASKDRPYDRRDAMTQAGAFSKSKPMLVDKGAPSGTARPSPVKAAPPPPPAAQPSAAPADENMDEGAFDDVYGGAAAQVQQQGPSGGSLSLRDGKRGATGAAAADEEAESAQLAALDGQRLSEQKREERSRAAEMASAPAPASAPSAAPPVARAERQQSSSARLSELASAALRSGDRIREAQYLRQALAAGATGKERLGLLNRLCEAEFSIGRREAAIEACNMVLEEDPRSSAAQMARRRLSQEAPAAKPDSRFSAPKSTSPLKADELEAPSAPAQSR